MGMDWSSLGQSTLTSAADSALGSVVSLLGASHMRRQQEKLMAKQFGYSQQAFQAENARQDYLLNNSPSIQKQALQAAGYSTADPSGSGFVSGASTNNNTLDVPSVPSVGQMNIPNMGIMSGYGTLVQSKYIDSQTRLNDIEAKFRAKKLGAEIDLLNTEIDQKREAWPTQLAQMKQNLENSVSQGYLTERQAQYVQQQTDNLRESLQGIKLDNKFNEETLSKRVKIVSAQLEDLLKSNRIKEAQALLADYGIVTTSDGLTMMFTSLLSGKADELTSRVVDGFNQLIQALPEVIGQVFTNTFEGLKSAPGKFWKYIKKSFIGID